MKQHPAVIEDTGTHKKSLAKAQEMINDIVTMVRDDEKSRNEWEHRSAKYYRRRYMREDLGTDWPWPGASDIVMPTIDMTIDRLKSTISRVIFTRPNVSFKARNVESQGKTKKAELFFDWLLNEGIPDFREEVFIGLDSMLQYGFAAFKVYWDFRTRMVERLVRREDLGAADMEQIVPDAARSLANNLFVRSGRVLPQSSATTVLKSQIRQFMNANESDIKLLIARKWNLDDSEEVDKKAIQKIFTFLKEQKEEVRFRTKEILANNPRLATVAPEDLIVPGQTHGLQEASRITHRLFLSKSTFRQRGKDQGWSDSAVRQILEANTTTHKQRTRGVPNSTIERDRDNREGLNQHEQNDLIEIWEHYCWMDVNGDGVAEPVVSHIQPDTKLLLKDIQEIPFEHGEFPFVQMKFEINDRRFYSSRGVPEKIDDIDREITYRHRNKLNNMDMMVPTFTYRYASEFNPDNVQFIPGEMYPVLQQDDIQPLAVPDRTLNDEREENILLTWNERYLGGFDALSAQQNISEARTATEVQALQRSASEVLSYRAMIVQLGMKKIYRQIWALWNQWGPEETFIRVTRSRMEKLTKTEIQGQFDIVPVGTIETTDPVLEAQRALARLDVLTRMKQLEGQGLLGTDFEIRLDEALRLFLEKDNAIDSELVMRERTEQEKQLIQQQQARRQALIEAAQTNQPQTIPEMKAALAEIKREAPFGASQQIRPGNGTNR
jgi:hypothetical protein